MAFEVADADASWIEYGCKIREHFWTLAAIKMAIAGVEGDLTTAKEAWSELSMEDQQILWRAPTKGGILTTNERKALKGQDFETGEIPPGYREGPSERSEAPSVTVSQAKIPGDIVYHGEARISDYSDTRRHGVVVVLELSSDSSVVPFREIDSQPGQPPMLHCTITNPAARASNPEPQATKPQEAVCEPYEARAEPLAETPTLEKWEPHAEAREAPETTPKPVKKRRGRPPVTKESLIEKLRQASNYDELAAAWGKAHRWGEKKAPAEVYQELVEAKDARKLELDAGADIPF